MGGGSCTTFAPIHCTAARFPEPRKMARAPLRAARVLRTRLSSCASARCRSVATPHKRSHQLYGGLNVSRRLAMNVPLAHDPDTPDWHAPPVPVPPRQKKFFFLQERDRTPRGARSGQAVPAETDFGRMMRAGSCYRASRASTSALPRTHRVGERRHAIHCAGARIGAPAQEAPVGARVGIGAHSVHERGRVSRRSPRRTSRRSPS
jgi:hypothetical protein